MLPGLSSRVWCTVLLLYFSTQRIRRVCADPTLTAEDAQDAFEALLCSISTAPVGLITVPAAAVSAAAEHVRELYLLLEPSEEQQQRLDRLVVLLGSRAATDLQLSRFWLAYEVSQSVVGTRLDVVPTELELVDRQMVVSLLLTSAWLRWLIRAEHAMSVHSSSIGHSKNGSCGDAANVCKTSCAD
jgi:hypothetical protein